jgi:hypothetical protein
LVLYKLIKVLSKLSGFIYQIYSKIVPPIKRVFLFEYRSLKIIFKNLAYKQHELYPTLKDDNFVGVVYNVNLPKIHNNPIIKSIAIIALQLLLVGFFLNKDFIEGGLMELKNTAITIAVGFVLAIIYIMFRKNDVKPNNNVFMKSSLGAVISPIEVDLITPMQINALLTTANFSSTQEINFSIKSKNSSYPLLHEYFCGLQGSKNDKKRCLLYNAFIELFSYLYLNRDVKASLVELGHGGASVFHHSLHVAEYGLSLFSNDVYKQYEEAVKDRLVFTCLGHDLGKIKCFNENRENYNGHEQLSYFILGRLLNFNQIDNEIRDDVLHLTNNQSKTFVDESEILVVSNHMFKTADTKASELEGMQMSEEKIMSIYRISFYDLLRNKDAVSKCATLIDGFIYVSINDFMKEIIKITKQTFTVENYANTGLFKQISKLFMLDGLYARGFENVQCHIVFIDKATNREIKRYSQCLILKYDMIMENDNFSSDIVVGLQAKDSIAKLVIKDGVLTYDSSIKNTEISKIDTPTVNPVKEEPSFLAESVSEVNDFVEDDPTVATIPEMSVTQLPDDHPPAPDKSKNKHSHYKKLSLAELENLYLDKLRSVGFIVNKIEFETKTFIRCPVHGKNFPAGSYKAFVRGVPNLHYIVYKTKTFEQGHDNIEFKDNFKVSGYSYDGLEKEWEDKLKQDEFNVKELQGKLATLQGILSEKGDNSIFSLLNVDQKKVESVFNNKCFKESIFTVMVENFDTGKHSGYIQIKIHNQELIESANDKLISSGSNYILISAIKEIGNLSSVLLVDNLADGIFLFNYLELPILVYFDLAIAIQKIDAICTIPKIIATNYLDFETELDIAEKNKCQIINPFGLFESSHKDLIVQKYPSETPLDFYRCGKIYESQIDRYIHELNKQLELTQLESITNANKLFNFHKDQFRSL